MNTSPGNRLDWVEAMRGFAATWVLVAHAGQATSAFIGDFPATPLVRNGYLGVDFFFVLSGFIISFAAYRLAERGGGIRDYIQSRSIRIFIPYLPIGIAMYIGYLLLPGLSEGDRNPGLLTSLLLLPSESPPALSVAWTLVHELIFYAIFSIWFFSRRVFLLVVFAWVMVILWVYWQKVGLTRLGSYFLSPLNLCFVLGMVVYQLSRRYTPGPGVVLVLAILGLSVVLNEASTPDPSRIFTALGFAILVLASANPSAMSIRVPRVLVMLGAASYAIYLVHNPALSVVARAWRWIGPGLDPWLGMAAIALVALSAGLLYWWLYERRALDASRRLVSGKNKPSAAQSSKAA